MLEHNYLADEHHLEKKSGSVTNIVTFLPPLLIFYLRICSEDMMANS